MDIDKLRLTAGEEEITLRTAFPNLWPELIVRHGQNKAIADAQLGKALWGVVDWLSSYDDLTGASDALWSSLHDAGIERPNGDATEW